MCEMTSYQNTKGNVRCLQIGSRRDLTIHNLQQPSPVPNNALISLRRDLIQALQTAPFQISHVLSPPSPSHTSCKSIHSFGHLSCISGFSVPCIGRNWGHSCQAVHPTLTRTCLFSLYSPGHITPKSASTQPLATA